MTEHLTASGASALDELGLDQAFVIKGKLALRLQRTIVELGLTQREAAALMPISQPKLSLLSRGRLDDISQAKLEECLRALGHDIEIAIGPRRQGLGRISVRELAA